MLFDTLCNALRWVAQSHLGFSLNIILVRKKLVNINYITFAGIIKHSLFNILINSNLTGAEC